MCVLYSSVPLKCCCVFQKQTQKNLNFCRRRKIVYVLKMKLRTTVVPQKCEQKHYSSLQHQNAAISYDNLFFYYLFIPYSSHASFSCLFPLQQNFFLKIQPSTHNKQHNSHCKTVPKKTIPYRKRFMWWTILKRSNKTK